MGRYITSVQLTNAVQSDYERLDLEMAKEHFIRVAGVAPGALVYNFRGGDDNLQAVVSAAYTAASQIGKQYSLHFRREFSSRYRHLN